MIEQNARSALEMSDYGIVLELGQTRIVDKAAACSTIPAWRSFFWAELSRHRA